MNMQEIESLTKTYAEARAYLTGVVAELQAELERVKHPVLPVIRGAVNDVSKAHDALKTALEISPELFDKPRTRTFHTVKVGYRKQAGKVEIPDEGKTIQRIETLLPEEQAELLIKTTKSVHKPSVSDLTAADLKRLGIRITDDTDEVVIKPVASDVDKLVNALLAEIENMEVA